MENLKAKAAALHEVFEATKKALKSLEEPEIGLAS